MEHDRLRAGPHRLRGVGSVDSMGLRVLFALTATRTFFVWRED